MSFRRLFAALLLILLVTERTALAWTPPPARATTPAPEVARRWYGWQVLLADAATIGLVAASPAMSGSNPLLLEIAGVNYLAGGPAIHLVHQRWGIAGASVGLRLLLPVLGVLAGAALGSHDRSPPACDGCDSGWSGAGWVIGGGLVGMGVASILDIALLAYEPVLERRRRERVARARAPAEHTRRALREAHARRRRRRTYRHVLSGAARPVAPLSNVHCVFDTPKHP